MIRLGSALKSAENPYHRLVVLSDPLNNGGQVVLVRVTTDDGNWPDRDCIPGTVGLGGTGTSFNRGLFHH